MKKHLEWLRHELDGGVADGLVQKEQADAIRARYPEPGPGLPWGVIIFSSLGGIIIGLGVILLFAYNWHTIPKFGKLEMEVKVAGNGLAVLKGYRWSPLGIGLTLDFDKERHATGATVRLLNSSDKELAIVDLPGSRSFALDAEVWNGEEKTWRWAGADTPRPAVAAEHVRVLKPGESCTFKFDFADPAWFIAKTGEKPRPIGQLNEWQPRGLSNQFVLWAEAAVSGRRRSAYARAGCGSASRRLQRTDPTLADATGGGRPRPSKERHGGNRNSAPRRKPGDRLPGSGGTLLQTGGPSLLYFPFVAAAGTVISEVPMACRKAVLLLLSAVLVPWLGGCAFLSSSLSSFHKAPQYTVTLHEVVKSSNPDQNRVMVLSTFTGTTVAVRVTPLLSSCQFRQIKKVQETGKPIALDVSLDTHGAFVWTVIRRDMIGQEIAVAVDGWCQGICTIPAMTTAADTVMRLPGPWDEATADAVVSHAEENYSDMNEAQRK